MQYLYFCSVTIISFSCSLFLSESFAFAFCLGFGFFICLFVWDYIWFELRCVTVYCNPKILLLNSNGQLKLIHFVWKIVYLCVHAWKFIWMSFIHMYIKLFDNVMSNNSVIKTFLQFFRVSPHLCLREQLNVSTTIFIGFLLARFSRLLMSILNYPDPSFNDKKQLITLTLFPVLINK